MRGRLWVLVALGVWIVCEVNGVPVVGAGDEDVNTLVVGGQDRLEGDELTPSALGEVTVGAVEEKEEQQDVSADVPEERTAYRRSSSPRRRHQRLVQAEENESDRSDSVSRMSGYRSDQTASSDSRARTLWRRKRHVGFEEVDSSGSGTGEEQQKIQAYQPETEEEEEDELLSLSGTEDSSSVNAATAESFDSRTGSQLVAEDNSYLRRREKIAYDYDFGIDQILSEDESGVKLDTDKEMIDSYVASSAEHYALYTAAEEEQAAATLNRHLSSDEELSDPAAGSILGRRVSSMEELSDPEVGTTLDRHVGSVEELSDPEVAATLDRHVGSVEELSDPAVGATLDRHIGSLEEPSDSDLGTPVGRPRGSVDERSDLEAEVIVSNGYGIDSYGSYVSSGLSQTDSGLSETDSGLSQTDEAFVAASKVPDSGYYSADLGHDSTATAEDLRRHNGEYSRGSRYGQSKYGRYGRSRGSRGSEYDYEQKESDSLERYSTTRDVQERSKETEAESEEYRHEQREIEDDVRVDGIISSDIAVEAGSTYSGSNYSGSIYPGASYSESSVDASVASEESALLDLPVLLRVTSSEIMGFISVSGFGFKDSGLLYCRHVLHDEVALAKTTTARFINSELILCEVPESIFAYGPDSIIDLEVSIDGGSFSKPQSYSRSLVDVGMGSMAESERGMLSNMRASGPLVSESLAEARIAGMARWRTHILFMVVLSLVGAFILRNFGGMRSRTANNFSRGKLAGSIIR